MTFNSKSRIPLELYPLIIGHIDDKSDLLTMLVSSKAIFADVERKLYNSLQFGWHKDHEDDNRHILFLESVLDAKRPHLSGLIYRYCYFTTSRTNAALLSLIKRALITFTNLKQLRFGVLDEKTFASVLPLENPPFQLELFQWVGLEIARLDVGVLRFLASQHSLKTLSIYNGTGGSELPQISPLHNLQNLHDVIGSAAIILPLLPPSVPIKRVHWILDVEQDLQVDSFPLLTELRVLSFAPYTLRPPLSVITQRFGTIEVLGLHSLQHGELPDLYRLSLHTLVLHDMKTVANFTDEIFRNMKFLQHIFVSTNGTGGYLSQYRRWGRDAQTATLVSSHIVETNWWCQL